MSLLLLTLAAYFLWSLLRRKPPLAIIPGPHKDHWLTGTRLHSSLPYSTLSRQLPSPFSRRIPLQPCPGREIWRRPQGERIAWGNQVNVRQKLSQLTCLQTQQLYVSDPLALYHIVVKDQHIYTETDMFILRV